MANSKVIIISIVSGFVLSFLIGIISGVSVGIVVLRALLFALAFGVVMFGADFVFRRFLAFGGEAETALDSSEAPRTGTKIDISIGDEPLPDDGNGPDFYVDNTDSISSDTVSDSSAKKSVTEDRVTSSGEALSAKPESQGDKSESVPASVAKSDNDTAASQSGFQPVSLGASVSPGGSDVSSESLDVLPDVSDFTIADSGHGEVLENTDFALEGSFDSGGYSSGGSKNSASTGVMDTEIIAKAIKTALSKDS